MRNQDRNLTKMQRGKWTFLVHFQQCASPLCIIYLVLTPVSKSRYPITVSSVWLTSFLMSVKVKVQPYCTQTADLKFFCQRKVLVAFTVFANFHFLLTFLFVNSFPRNSTAVFEGQKSICWSTFNSIANWFYYCLKCLKEMKP